jgi:hypothetical protein
MKLPRTTAIAWGIAAMIASSAYGQHRAMDILKSLPDTNERPRFFKSTGSEGSQELSQAARTIRGAVMLVGHPDAGFATGFLISRANRLVATNAHVADIYAQMSSLYAVSNETTNQYEVERVFYHPAVIRIDPQGRLVRPGPNSPGAGEVYQFSPDVAVLQLKPGPDLPAQVEFASAKELADLWSSPVGMAGFSGTDQTSFPEKEKLVSASLRGGEIDHLTTFNRDISANPANNQIVEYSMDTWHGFSGAPVFLENGHVVAINNSHQSFHSGDMSTTQAYGIRIDCLWELIQNDRDLAALMPGVPQVSADQMQQHVTQAPEPDQSAWAAMKLLDAARPNSPTQRIDVCTQAINQKEKLPSAYAAYAYVERGIAYKDKYYESVANGAAQADLLDLVKKGASDFEQARDLDKNFIPIFVDAHLQLCWLAFLQETLLKGQQADYSTVINHLNQILAERSLSRRQRALGLQSRAFCRKGTPQAEDDFQKAINLLPYWPDNYQVRADYWTSIDRSSDAAKDKERQTVIEGLVAKSHAAKEKALEWQVDHSTEATVIDHAVADAKAACDETECKNWTCLDCLVHVYRAKGDTVNAIKSAVMARACAMDDAEQLHSVNDVFQSRRDQQQQRRSP